MAKELGEEMTDDEVRVNVQLASPRGKGESQPMPRVLRQQPSEGTAPTHCAGCVW